MMKAINITKNSFDHEVVRSEQKVLLDFWAPWCGPCRMLAPAVAQIAEEYEGKAKVGKVNVDDEPELAARFGISGIPTVLVFKNGQLAETLVGLRPKAVLEALLNQ